MTIEQFEAVVKVDDMTLEEFEAVVKVDDTVCVWRLDLHAIYLGYHNNMLCFKSRIGDLQFQVPLSTVSFAEPFKGRPGINFMCL